MSLYILMILVFISYVSYIWVKYGVQKSISASYYQLPDFYKFLFTLFCWGFAVPALVIGNNLLLFVACAGICFVGAAPDFNSKESDDVHFIAAAFGIATSQIYIYSVLLMPWVSVISGLIFLILYLGRKRFFKNHIWWIEIVAFASICYALGYNLFI